MSVPIIGLSCANCGQEVSRADARELAYASAVALESPDRPGLCRGIATFRFAVMRPLGPDESCGMLLCDGCMGAALKATCQAVLDDMEVMRGPSSQTVS